MKDVAEAGEKKRKRMMPRSAGSGSSSGAPPKYRMVYTPPGVSCVDHSSSRIWAIADNSSNNSHSSSSSTTVPLLHHHSRLPSGRRSSSPLATFYASTAGRWPLCLRMPPAQAKQLAVSSGTRGQSADGPSKGSCTTDGSCQLHHPGGDSHERRCASRYVLPQRTSRYYSV
jgi:hypothetical protein